MHDGSDDDNVDDEYSCDDDGDRYLCFSLTVCRSRDSRTRKTTTTTTIYFYDCRSKNLSLKTLIKIGYRLNTVLIYFNPFTCSSDVYNIKKFLIHNVTEFY